MDTFSEKTQQDKSESFSHEEKSLKAKTLGGNKFVDNRPEAIVQRKMQSIANNSGNKKAQLKKKDGTGEASQEAKQKKENSTGLPDKLKSSIEQASGMDMSHVKVHYNSAKPVELGAFAYTQGSDIYIGPGQEKHLSHEAWHVVQQQQGRVKSTMQMKGGVDINDDAGLEKEADVMGAKLRTESIQKKSPVATKKESKNAVKQFQLNEAAEKELNTAIGQKNLYGPDGMKDLGRDEKGKPLEQKTPEAKELDKDAWSETKHKFIVQFVKLLGDVPDVDIPSRMGNSLWTAASTVYDDLMQSTGETNPEMDKLPKDQSGYDKVAEVDLEKGQITGAQPQYLEVLTMTETLANELKELVKKSKKAKDLAANGFAFWSGYPAKNAAADSGLQSLEGSALGGMFEGSVLPRGQVNMSWWGAVSKAYAEWASEDVQGKEFKGFVGLGGDRVDSIYNSVERWVFGVTSVEGAQPPSMSWIAVVPIQESYDVKAKTGKAFKGNPYDKTESIINTYNASGPERGTRQSAVNAMVLENEKREKIAEEKAADNT